MSNSRSVELAQLMRDLVQPVLEAWVENNQDKEEGELLGVLRLGVWGVVADLSGFAEIVEAGCFQDECGHGIARDDCDVCKQLAIELMEGD